jgi:mono/diheme cytochrome c family protein
MSIYISNTVRAPSLSGAAILTALFFTACHRNSAPAAAQPPEAGLVEVGKQMYRYDTFGDERQWTDGLRLHEVVGTLPPTVALAVGLKVDADAVPEAVLASADLEDPATTLALIELGAVVGIVGRVESGQLTSLGVTCALCHSTVDDRVAPGIGSRLDGWANTDLDPGRILALSPAVQDPVTLAALRSWGPGKYDARFNQDGESDPAVIPPAYGLRDVSLTTFTGDGDISYWNAYVAITQMGGRGVFHDPRIGLHVARTPDLVTPKLAALAAYQHSLSTPTPPAFSFEPGDAEAGRALFAGAARCSECHSGPTFSDGRLHPPALVGTDPRHAQRSATGLYRTTPLRGLWQHPPYFHDGSAATLGDVVRHYDDHLQLRLDDEQVRVLVEYLKSL